MDDPQRPPHTEAELRTIAIPADTNRFGDIFGGWLLAQMDLAGGSYAMARTGGRVATVGIEAMSFHRAVSPPSLGATGTAVTPGCAMLWTG